MRDKKIGKFVLAFFSLVLFLGFASATLEIKDEAVSSMAIPELNLPAIFNLEIKNLGQSDNFNIYTFVSMTLEPNETFHLASGETKKLTLKVYSNLLPKISPEYLSFEYRIKGEKTPVQIDELAISIVYLKDAFNFYIDEINPESEKAIVHFENKGGHNFEKVTLSLSSVFFDEKFEFPLNAYESKKIEVPLNEKRKELLAGPYIVNAEITVKNVAASTSTIMNFVEKPGIKTTEASSGFFLRRYEIEKRNEGNTKTEVSVVITKNLFSTLFTRFSVAPYKREISGFKIKNFFRKELSPNESLKVVAITNWWILLGIIVAVAIIYYLIDKYVREKLVLKKKVSFVRTKGGEFALKVSIIVKARDFVEKIRLLDRLPPMVKVFERFGVAAPDRIDEKNRRLEWDISALSKGEERILSYIIYSKIGIVGKFELPPAEAIYEYKGKIKEARSNKAFFVNEQKEK